MESFFDCQSAIYGTSPLLYWPEMLDVSGGGLPNGMDLNVDADWLLNPTPPSLEASCASLSPDIDGQARLEHPDATGTNFNSDLDMLLDQTVSMENKRWVFHTIFGKPLHCASLSPAEPSQTRFRSTGSETM